MRLLLLSCLIVLLVAACAIGDSPDAALTQMPPVTLQPAPTPIFAGECTRTADLDAWLANSHFLTQGFMDSMYGAALMNAVDARVEVIRMASLRDQMSRQPAPDCVVEAHLILLTAMGQAVDVFQAFANGDRPDLGSTVVDVRAQLDTFLAQQAELTQRLEQQYQATRTAAAPDSP
ncbi:MAG: hypothetical protein HXY40_06660 [Chloroflexi bacterium]|nr:hypothetical protein [Chloroflexota bacterium]